MIAPTSPHHFDCLIVSPDKTLFEGKIKKLNVPGKIQELAILPDHTPIYAELVAGEIVILLENGQSKSISIESGVLRFRQNRASIITGFGGNLTPSK